MEIPSITGVKQDIESEKIGNEIAVGKSPIIPELPADLILKEDGESTNKIKNRIIVDEDEEDDERDHSSNLKSNSSAVTSTADNSLKVNLNDSRSVHPDLDSLKFRDMSSHHDNRKRSRSRSNSRSRYSESNYDNYRSISITTDNERGYILDDVNENTIKKFEESIDRLERKGRHIRILTFYMTKTAEMTCEYKLSVYYRRLLMKKELGAIYYDRKNFFEIMKQETDTRSISTGEVDNLAANINQAIIPPYRDKSDYISQFMTIFLKSSQRP